MVRENAGYALADVSCPSSPAVAEFAQAGVDGIVIGFAARGGAGDRRRRARARGGPRRSRDLPRAFDAIARSAECHRRPGRSPANRSDPHGRRRRASIGRCERLQAYAARAAGRLTVIAGNGVTDETLGLFARTGCVREVHVGRAAREEAIRKALCRPHASGGCARWRTATACDVCRPSVLQHPCGEVTMGCKRRIRSLRSARFSARPGTPRQRRLAGF